MAELLREPSRKNFRCLPNLTSLHNLVFTDVDTPVCQRGDIELVASTCVSVNKVSIRDNRVVKTEQADVLLLELRKLEKICELRMENYRREATWTFNGGILPLMKHFSRSLTYLALLHLNTPINISSIVENCPKLKTLILYYCKVSPRS